MSLSEHTKSASSLSGEEDDIIIELTEVVEEGPVGVLEGNTEAEPKKDTTAKESEDTNAEVLLDFRPGGDDLESLKALFKPPEEKQEDPPSAPQEESLDDFLASLPDLPEDLDISPMTAPLQQQATRESNQELVERLSDEELRELVRQIVQEKVERLVQEVLPKMAAEAIERELTLWKKRLTESD